MTPSPLAYHEYLFCNSERNTNTEQILYTIKQMLKMQTAAMLVRHTVKYFKCIRTSRQPTLNQVQNQQKYRNILLIMNDPNDWRTWNTVWKDESKGPYMPPVSGNGFWKSWSTACTLTAKIIWRCRPPHFDCWNYFRGYYNEKMLSDVSLEEARSKWLAKQPRKFPKYLLLCSHSALELLLREVPSN